MWNVNVCILFRFRQIYFYSLFSFVNCCSVDFSNRYSSSFSHEVKEKLEPLNNSNSVKQREIINEVIIFVHPVLRF